MPRQSFLTRSQKLDHRYTTPRWQVCKLKEECVRALWMWSYMYIYIYIHIYIYIIIIIIYYSLNSFFFSSPLTPFILNWRAPGVPSSKSEKCSATCRLRKVAGFSCMDKLQEQNKYNYWWEWDFILIYEYCFRLTS
jgi:hypothetical protein